MDPQLQRHQAPKKQSTLDRPILYSSSELIEFSNLKAFFVGVQLKCMALATALFGPWLDSFMRLVGVVCHCLHRLSCGTQPGICHHIYTIRRGGLSSPSSTRHGHSQTS
jgi:hypothetical protein